MTQKTMVQRPPTAFSSETGPRVFEPKGAFSDDLLLRRVLLVVPELQLHVVGLVSARERAGRHDRCDMK